MSHDATFLSTLHEGLRACAGGTSSKRTAGAARKLGGVTMADHMITTYREKGEKWIQQVHKEVDPGGSQQKICRSLPSEHRLARALHG